MMPPNNNTGGGIMSRASWAQWLGNTETREELISVGASARIAAAFDKQSPAHGDDLPWLWHWCFFQDAAPTQLLAKDGHPLPGSFLPPVHDRPRMWAGGRVRFLSALRVGEPAQRHSEVVRCEEKTGKSGSLVFVTVAHEYHQAGQVCIREEQDIVYKTPAPWVPQEGERPPRGDWDVSVLPSNALLFRYSAVTFNTHRIHYDLNYATETEGYPGLVVHGPLVATLNLTAFVEANPLAIPKAFSFRNIRALIAPERFQTAGRHTETGVARLWAANGTGICQQAEVLFE